MSSTSFGAAEVFVDKGFKDAENTIIDILRLKDPTLDSRSVTFDSTDITGGFAVCCYKQKYLNAKDSKSGEVLGKFTVAVGNTNYKDYENGIVQTTIVTQERRTYVEPFWKCQDEAGDLVKGLFPPTASIERSPKLNDTFASAYTFEVKDASGVVGRIILNAAGCKLQSVDLNPQPQSGLLNPPDPQ